MDIIKQFTTSQGKFCVVKIPTEATDINIGYIERQIEYIINGEYHFIDNLPTTKGTKLELIGLSDEITEEQAKSLVDKTDNPFWIGLELIYIDYLKDQNCFETALESFKSLMQSLELYEEIPAPKCGCYGPSDKGCCEGCDEWVESQSKVGRYAVLKEVKK